MEMPTSTLTGITLKDMFDAGLHFGHQTKRWNPKMKGYIFDKRNGIHVIDLTQSVALLDEAAEFLKKTVLDGKKVLFVATKKQVSELVKGAAESVEQFYMTERWLGGTLTNSKTLRSSVKRMRQLQATAKANGGELSPHKQEASMLRRELNKLEKNLTGVADMAELPGAVVVVDVVREANAVKEAVRLHIPVVAIVDTNADPEPIDYVIPGNDDSVRGVELVIGGLVKVIKEANDEYSAKAAEEAARGIQYSIVWERPDASWMAVFCGVGGLEMKNWKLNFAGKIDRDDLAKHTVARIKKPEEFYAPFPARYCAPSAKGGKKSAAATKPSRAKEKK